MLAFGCGALSAGWLIGGQQGPNTNVTIYNTGALLGAMFNAFGSLMLLRNEIPQSVPARRRPTLLRQSVLGAAIVLFLLSALIGTRAFVKKKNSFHYWYALSLTMIALGLIAFFVQSAVGSPIGWLGRLGQYVGGIFALVAVGIVFKAAHVASVSVPNAMAAVFQDAELAYQALVETAADPIILFDPNGTIVQWNAAAEQVFAYGASEALGSSLFDLVVDKSFAQAFRNEVDNLKAISDRTKVGLLLEIEGKTKGQGVVPVEVSISAMKTRDRWICIGVFRNITKRKQTQAALELSTRELARSNAALEQRVAERTAELQQELAGRKQAQEALAVSEERLRFHADNSPLAVVEWDASFFVTRWTGAAQSVFGWSANEVIGRQVADLQMIYEEDVSIVQQTMERLADGVTKTLLSTNRNYTKDRKVIVCEWYNSVLNDRDGKLISVMSQVRDITENRRNEAQLVKQLDELRRWQQMTLGREGRVAAVKKEVNALLAEHGLPPRYTSVLHEEPEK